MSKATKTGPARVLQPIQIQQLETSPDIPKGKVLVVEMRPDGTEKGNGFTIGEATYNRVFANNPKFKLKKKSDRD